ncbi:RING-HC finger protein [Sansalvadorimonas sp. 2012CJ34-2]|uniref:RING-HC finger protein n=1 Tax=Parendozoicomonas callyspongiae TaxID=2942213 RepID=A0ABT0PFJ1_9GAMM|nr:RING finger protein [Sansalvadorimonas sp. 2012CJ34-2]MCL6270147.1 RING-HC finger protein [Sansalvadorimonas sp. 2012CJ34-2]
MNPKISNNVAISLYRSHLKSFEGNYHSVLIELTRKGNKKEYDVLTTIPKSKINECTVCQYLPVDPVLYCSSSDRHILCRECHKKLPEDNKVCPNCRSPDKQDGDGKINKEQEELFNNIEYSCPAGCNETMGKALLEAHFPDCEKFSCIICGLTGNIEEIEKHEPECKIPMEMCVYCEGSYPFDGFIKHQSECEKFPLTTKLFDGTTITLPRKQARDVSIVTEICGAKSPIVRVVDGDGKTTSCRLSDESCQAIRNGILLSFHARKSTEIVLPTAQQEKIGSEDRKGSGSYKYEKMGIFGQIFNEDWTLKNNSVDRVTISRLGITNNYRESDRAAFIGCMPVRVLVSNTKEDDPRPYYLKELMVYLGFDTGTGPDRDSKELFVGFERKVCSEINDHVALAKLNLSVMFDAGDYSYIQFVKFSLWEWEQYDSHREEFGLRMIKADADVKWLPLKLDSGDAEKCFKPSGRNDVTIKQILSL